MSPLTATSYISGIVATVNEYKEARDLIEKMFDEIPWLPDTCLSAVGDPSLSDEENLKKKRELYHWTTQNGYPPYLQAIPSQDAIDTFKIFDPNRFQAVQAQNIPGEIGQFFSAFGTDKVTMASIEQRYRDLHKAAMEAGQPDVYTAPNVGLRSDWYTDAVFAQQQLTGVNPTGLKRASQEWIEAFAQVAVDQKNTAAQQLLAGPSSFYIVDNSDYRYILGLAADAPIVSTGTALGSFIRWPFAVDYRGSLKAETSVTIFNKRLTSDATGVDESIDWPWRAAKMFASVSDWARHELVVHLTETHLVEEAIIVAAQRNLPDSHIISQLLHPHWYKTLSLNFLARLTLVPVFIEKVAPLQLPQIKDFIKQSYMNFDFTGRYVPNDLKNRGFDPRHLDDKKFHNYLYARNISKCWDVLHEFVSEVLHDAYPCGDVDVLADKYVAGFSAEMRSQQGGQLPSFPVVKTLDELIDMVTMCIHIAAPQHTAVNYLQQFYLSFVPNRPGSLAAPLPSSLEQLQGYTEDHLVASLPITGFDRAEWMLMALVPYLLSAEVDPESNIQDYAESTKESANKHIAKAGVKFSKKINALKAVFDKYNEEMDDHVTPYHVLDPNVMAQSILI
ncbi:hypothetical protein NMY22_g15780 [Coprinellus aureogranulatus]|nr:hypothetical protein NMY22_g15780 [Coprinellus aureogranulatus]